MAVSIQHECDNCGWIGAEDELGCVLADMEDLFERIDPGCPVPSGDCPECGACAYPIDDNWRKHEAYPVLLNALVEIHKLWCCPAPRTLKDWSARCDVMADYARKAIAKAEGRSNA